MAITNQVLTTGAATTVFTGAGLGNAVTTMYLCNVTGSSVTANIFIVPSGQIADPSKNVAYYAKTITSHDTLIIDMEKLVLGPGDFIAANCSVTNSIAMTVSTLAV